MRIYDYMNYLFFKILIISKFYSTKSKKKNKKYLNYFYHIFLLIDIIIYLIFL